MVDVVTAIVVVAIKSGVAARQLEHWSVIGPRWIWDEHQLVASVETRNCLGREFYAATAADALEN